MWPELFNLKRDLCMSSFLVAVLIVCLINSGLKLTCRILALNPETKKSIAKT